MNNSKIISFIIFFIKKIGHVYSESLLARAAAKFNSFILHILKTSLVYKIIIHNWDRNESMIINKIFMAPDIKGTSINEIIINSRILMFFKSIFDNMYYTTVRYIGLTFLFFSSIALLKGKDFFYGNYIFILNIGLGILGIILFFINKPIISLFKGSSILKLIGNMFTAED